MPKRNPTLSFNGRSLYILGPQNHDIDYFYSDQVTTNFDEADVLLVVGSHNDAGLESAALAAGKIVAHVAETYCCETASQKELARTDWQMIRKLEALLPEDDPLRVLRNQLRVQVDEEI